MSVVSVPNVADVDVVCDPAAGVIYIDGKTVACFRDSLVID